MKAKADGYDYYFSSSPSSNKAVQMYKIEEQLKRQQESERKKVK
jgi:hypothetical protein